MVEGLCVEGLLEPQGSASQLGLLAGENYGAIRSCSAKGTVSGQEDVGGLVGVNGETGRIEGSSSQVQIDHRQAAVEALDQSFSTILTSGTIMSVAGFLIGGISTNATIGSVGLTLGRGTVTSIVLVMTVLPQLLMLGDALIERTAITLNRDRKQRFNQGTMRLDGHIRGHVSGFVDGEFKGVLHGSVDALIESKYQQLDLPDTGKEDPHETV